MLINEPITDTLTISSGVASKTFTEVKNKRLVSIYINPATNTTTYDLAITDVNSEIIYDEDDLTGKFIDNGNRPQYVYGNFTLNITNASADEDFVVIVVFSEEVH